MIRQQPGLVNHFQWRVLCQAVAQHFPLSDDSRANDVPGYSKDSNGRIAEQMAVDNLGRIDLYDILEELRRRVAALA